MGRRGRGRARPTEHQQPRRPDSGALLAPRGAPAARRRLWHVRAVPQRGRALLHGPWPVRGRAGAAAAVAGAPRPARQVALCTDWSVRLQRRRRVVRAVVRAVAFSNIYGGRSGPRRRRHRRDQRRRRVVVSRLWKPRPVARLQEYGLGARVRYVRRRRRPATIALDRQKMCARADDKTVVADSPWTEAEGQRVGQAGPIQRRDRERARKRATATSPRPAAPRVSAQAIKKHKMGGAEIARAPRCCRNSGAAERSTARSTTSCAAC